MNPSGSGLGLSICRRMLNEIECDLRLEKSEINMGSTFVFTMKARSYSTRKLTDKVDVMKKKKEKQDSKGAKNLQHVEFLY